MNRHIIVIADQSKGRITPVTQELITAAEELRHLTGLPVRLIIGGPKTADAVIPLAEKYGIDILILNPSDQETAEEFILKRLPPEIFEELNPAYVCMPHTTRGLDAAPALAVKLNAACITGVEKISRQDGAICFTRSILNDRITADIRSRANATVLTIAPGKFKSEPACPNLKRAGKISTRNLALSVNTCHLMGIEHSADDTSALDNADVIISAGNGIKEKENLDLIFQMAALFPKSAVTGSRPICDKKWLKYCRQVGITGATVAPKLYIACGISGASQHISGMQDSKFIVSINTDPNAAIFNISDICIIEDLHTFIPQFINTCKEFNAPEK